jgi:hypothetical protein
LVCSCHFAKFPEAFCLLFVNICHICLEELVLCRLAEAGFPRTAVAFLFKGPMEGYWNSTANGYRIFATLLAFEMKYWAELIPQTGSELPL